METNDIKLWIVPEGYEIDKEQSTERQVVLKKIEDKRESSWEEYCELMKGKDSCYIEDSHYTCVSSLFGCVPIVTEFESEGDAEAFAAFSKLLKLRKNWVGEWKPNWMDRTQKKYTIVVEGNELFDGLNTSVSCSMSFPTEEMRDEFFNTFRDLLEIAKPLL